MASLPASLTPEAAEGAGARRPRVLSFTTVFPRPGEPALGIFVARRLEQLAAHADIHVLAPVPLADYGRWRTLSFAPSPAPSERREYGVAIHHPRWWYPPWGGSANAWLLARQSEAPARALFRSWPFELIDAHFGYPDGVAAAKLAERLGVPFTLTLRGNETMHAQSPAIREAMARAMGRAGRIIAVSGPLADFARSLGADPAKVRTIPNGVDDSVFWPRERESARAKHGFAPSERIVLSAGYLIERKGHHRVMRALAEPGLGHVRLAIAGAAGREGSYEPTLRALVKELGIEERVTFLGAVPPGTLAELMSAADVFCLASSREGWPNVVHEALACGCPAVASDVGGVPDMIPGESHGYVVPAGDQQELTRALEAAFRRDWDREAISRRARSRSWKQVALEVLEEWKAVCAS